MPPLEKLMAGSDANMDLGPSAALHAKANDNSPENMVWYGMVWYGMVWSGMVWYGMVCIVCIVCIVCMVCIVCVLCKVR